MTDKFHVWFWNRRSTTEKFFMCALPWDAILTIALQFTHIEGLGIFVLVAFLTIIIGIIFSIVSFLVDEYKKYQAEKEREAEMIVRKLRGDEPKNANDVMAQLKAYAAVPKSSIAKKAGP